jgi:hypothetical protein
VRRGLAGIPLPDNTAFDGDGRETEAAHRGRSIDWVDGRASAWGGAIHCGEVRFVIQARGVISDTSGTVPRMMAPPSLAPVSALDITLKYLAKLPLLGSCDWPNENLLPLPSQTLHKTSSPVGQNRGES